MNWSGNKYLRSTRYHSGPLGANECIVFQRESLALWIGKTLKMPAVEMLVIFWLHEEREEGRSKGKGKKEASCCKKQSWRHWWLLNTCFLSFLTPAASKSYPSLIIRLFCKIPRLLLINSIPSPFRKWNDSASCRLWSRSPNSDRRLMHVSHLRSILWQEVHRETTQLKAFSLKLRCPEQSTAISLLTI